MKNSISSTVAAYVALYAWKARQMAFYEQTCWEMALRKLNSGLSPIVTVFTNGRGELLSKQITLNQLIAGAGETRPRDADREKAACGSGFCVI